MRAIISFLLLTTFISCGVQSQINRVFTTIEVDEIPEFIGGKDAKELYIAQNLKWPSEDFGYSGYVIVSAVINENGSIDSLRVKKSLCTFCDEEAKRVISKMPKWKPAVKERKKVACEIDIPIRFEIKN